LSKGSPRNRRDSIKVVTHPGRFHADEVFAVAALEMALGEIEVERTKDEDAIAESDIRVDIGGRHDPSAGYFDHHQRDGAGTRSSGVPFASFGLVWRRYGQEVCGSSPAAATIDRILVQPVDAADNGHRLTRPVVAGVHPFTVSQVIASLNPVWDEDLDPAMQDGRFAEAVGLAGRILSRQVAAAVARERAVPLLRAAIEDSADPRIVELQQRLPWRPLLGAASPHALFVVCPYPDCWGVHAVPKQGNSFASRISLPAPWAGLEGKALASATGVEDAIFCHRSRHFASAASRAGALALAQKALANAEGESAGG
jgi:uncharacterized UPF0160 family protein